MKKRLEHSVADFRFIHAIGVAETAADLASRFNTDKGKAWIAGLLHDCAKGFDDNSDEILELAQTVGIIPTETQMTNPKLFLHAPLSAFLARRDYEVNDQEILNAIKLHQSGDFNMTKLDKIIYISDWIEPNRKHMNDFRNLAQNDLDEAFFQIYAYSIKQVVQNEWNFIENVSDIYNSIWIERNRKSNTTV